MKCPFLSRLPSQLLRNYGTSLVAQFSEHCPALRALGAAQLDSVRSYCTVSGAEESLPAGHPNPWTGEKSEAEKCPFLRETMKQAAEDTAIDGQLAEKPQDEGGFNYTESFQKKLEEKKKEHAYRVFKKVKRHADNFPMASEFTGEKKKTIVWCSNDYLGMSCHRRVLEGAGAALRQYGAGAGGTRNISGNSILHEAVERAVADLHDKEAALVFTSCYNANETALSTLGRHLAQRGGVFFSDAGNHASMIEGIRHSGIKKENRVIFRHNDPEHLDELMSRYPKEVPKIVAWETVHSMSGAVCPLLEMCEVTKKHGGLSFVDEVHAVGLYGRRGGGISDRDGLADHIDIVSGTFGKAFGNMGGYIAGPAAHIDLVRSLGAGFIFTTSLAPPVLGGILAAIEVLTSSEGLALRAQHQRVVRYLRNALTAAGLPVEHCPSHIVPIHVGDPRQATAVSNHLLELGHYVQAINHPTVPRGEEKLRVAATPGHTREMVDLFVRDLTRVWRGRGLPLDTVCGKECMFCHAPRVFSALESRSVPLRACVRPYCPSGAPVASTAVAA